MPIINLVYEAPTPLKTFTVSWTETSDPTQFNPVYSDDATGLTAGSTAFDEFFGYSAVKLSTAGVETAEVTQTTPGQLDLSQLGTLTSGDNVMIKFPRLGIKMSKNGSAVTLSITEDPHAEADGFQYYAHSRGTFDNITDKDAFYLGAFKAYDNSGTLKSWSGQSPSVSITQQNSISHARANDGNSGSAGYDIIGFYQREFVNALYMMKYGNPDCQSVIGRGYTGGSAKVNTGGTVSQTLATYGTTSDTQQVKLFGLEDWWGNIEEWIGGICTDSSKNLWTALSGFRGDIKTSSPYASQGTYSPQSTNPCMTRIAGTNGAMFYPTSTVNNSSYNTYYCDYTTVSNTRLCVAGGYWYSGASAGAFRLTVAKTATATSNDVGNRLMFL